MRFILNSIFWTFVLVIAGGLAMHFHVDIPWISSWFGHLPGDIIVVKGKTLIYLPVASAALVSVAFNLLRAVLRF